MAKVKGFNPPETELSYEEKNGVLHYFGEFFRMIFGEGTVSPTDPETDFIGKSRRGERPSQQGEGTEAQKFYRKAFKNCTLLWNSLPEECPDPLPDPPPTSKKSVWDAKVKHGVTCTYYDLFMRCCIQWANWHAGEMPVGDCFPCEPICEYDLVYDYAASAETINQNDSATVAIKGSDGPFNWSVTGTGFTLGSAQTAGLTNTLYADESACGSATITVTDTCEGSVTGYVRCSVGQWVLKGNYCGPGMAGAAGTVYSVSSYEYFKVRAILGNKKQENKYNRHEVITERDAREGTYQEVCVDGPSPCPAWLENNCKGSDSKCLDYTVNCSAAWPPSPFFCSQDDLICRGYCGCGWNGSQYEWHMDFVRYHTPSGNNLNYYEWEC